MYVTIRNIKLQSKDSKCVCVLLTPFSGVVFFRIPQLVKKFFAFYGSRNFITLFARAFHFSVSLARRVQSTPFHLVLPSCHFPSGLGTRLLHSVSLLPHAGYVSRPSNLPWSTYEQKIISMYNNSYSMVTVTTQIFAGFIGSFGRPYEKSLFWNFPFRNGLQHVRL
jgi:hypothetical protein